MTTETIERKYVLTKIARGDWMLPSNDGRTIFRLYHDPEALAGETTDGGEMRRAAWTLWRWTGGHVVDTWSWSEWELLDGSLYTRTEAIREALRLS
ncbi:MAG TPA: hypothetical protein VGN13_05465 [Solirubrobacteraceae bacterium]|jgi:hypothetical protein